MVHSDLWLQYCTLPMEQLKQKPLTEQSLDIIVNIKREEKPLPTPLPASTHGAEDFSTEPNSTTTLSWLTSVENSKLLPLKLSKTEKWQKIWQSAFTAPTTSPRPLTWTPWTSSRLSTRDSTKDSKLIWFETHILNSSSNKLTLLTAKPQSYFSHSTDISLGNKTADFSIVSEVFLPLFLLFSIWNFQNSLCFTMLPVLHIIREYLKIL